MCCRRRWGRGCCEGGRAAVRTKLTLAVSERTTGFQSGELISYAAGFKYEKLWLIARVSVSNR